MRAAALAALVVLAACGPRLGTNDVELDYTATTKARPSIDLVRLCLSDARIDADVSPLGLDGVRIIVDADRADLVDWVMHTPGGLFVSALQPPEVGDVLALADGKRAVVALSPEASAQLAHLPADQQVDIGLHGRTLWHGSLSAYLEPHGLGLSLPRGNDPTTYRRVRQLVRELNAPLLPPMARTAKVALPTNWSLAILCLTLPLGVAIAWMFFVRRIDRARPEPWWLLLATLVLGGAGQQLSALAERTIWAATPYLDHRAMSLDLSLSALPFSLLLCCLVVGVLEEGAKLLATYALAVRRREFDEPIDGVVFACAAAIGFATMENIDYFTHDRFGDGVIAARSLDAVSGHMMYAAIWGYALGQRLVTKQPRLWRYFALAVLLHGAWDTAIDFGVPHASNVLVVVTTTLFLIAVRRGLRWGVVERGATVSSERKLFAVGRMPAFVLAVLSTFGFAYLLIELGYTAQFAGYRVSVDLLVRSALYGSLFIASVWGVATMMPLDVALDDAGVTFAGALMPWSAIRKVKRTDSWSLVVRGDRPLHLGPGKRETIDALEAALQARLQSRDASDAP
jgi:RsiW-degrading membrane proteinase PrsW (M82 family)